jgi:putative oxidoreductase
MLANRTDIALLLIRLAFGGGMLLAHGLPKLMRIIDGKMKFGDPIGIGAVPSLYLVTFAEFVCALLLIIGLFTRWATLPLIITMLVAAFVANAGGPWSDQEGAFLSLVAFAALLLAGPGRYSVDARRPSGLI